MTKTTSSPDTLPAWHTLETLAEGGKRLDLMSLFQKDPDRHRRFALSVDGLLLDYSKNLIDETIFSTLLTLAEQSTLEQQRDTLFNGGLINSSEQRAALHTALRGEREDGYRFGGEALDEQISATLAEMAAISSSIREGTWLGVTGKPVQDIVHIGIGGSVLGPQLACQALRPYRHPDLRVHFIANVDGEDVLNILNQLDPERTLVIVASKTFTTQETLLNTRTTLHWLENKLQLSGMVNSRQIIALTANRQNAETFGIPSSQILTFDEWVGGRYSVWSCVGLTISISLGHEHFTEMLSGARAMDRHFRSAPFAKNMPVILALLGIWYRNFLDAPSVAIIPYCQRLSLLPSYLQQLDMESNGKSVSQSGETIDYPTGPVLWGQTGTNAQHTFFQLFHQSNHLIPLDLVATVHEPESINEHHRTLLANLLAQASALMAGNRDQPDLPAHLICPGNKPSNMLLLDALTPYHLGQVLALYEHKVFVQGAIWNINSYDQWGVELGKGIASGLLSEHDSMRNGVDAPDPSTRQLLDHISRRTGLFKIP
ncbi:glucose-6-phosphate isomerase [Porticoccus hydrocarbonoclasticus]|jgi:glucose-6-phosphate isomerase|uniref:glucose-6-phosphate isomerase n=1 Tax=Porticoccus TaxID=1123967 RepID=UPI0023558996|nr:glucose-6-phosphate isomerase [Porticoccus hydrocarbonoclasticus]|tara:strand:+ start:19295 stop:20923 length:1629 start_codon:yes stop_codon:yes gene_type:complete